MQMHAHYLHPFIPSVCHTVGFPGVSDGKESACSAEDLGSIPGLEDPLEEGMATHSILIWGLPCSSAGKKSACNAGDLGSIPGLEDPL